jgi:hypothetical protein
MRLTSAIHRSRMACGGLATLAVLAATEVRAQVTVLEVDAKPLLEIGATKGPRHYLFDSVSDAKRLTDGRIVVANCGANELRVYDASGRHVSTSGGRGDGPGEFRLPIRLLRGGADTLIAIDRSLRRATLFRDGARLERMFHYRHGFEPVGRFADGTFLAFEALRSEPPPPRGPPLHRKSAILVRLGPGGDVVDTAGVFPGIESAGHLPQRFYRRLGLAVLQESFVAGPQDSAKFAELAPTGALLRQIPTLTQPAAPSDDIVRQWIDYRVGLAPAGMTENARTSAERRPWPDLLPAYGDFIAAADGRVVWVQDGYRGEAVPRGWTAYADGRAIARVTLPARFAALDFGADWVLGVQYGELDVERLVLLKLVPVESTSSAVAATQPWPPVQPRVMSCGMWR